MIWHLNGKHQWQKIAFINLVLVSFLHATIQPMASNAEPNRIDTLFPVGVTVTGNAKISLIRVTKLECFSFCLAPISCALIFWCIKPNILNSLISLSLRLCLFNVHFLPNCTEKYRGTDITLVEGRLNFPNE